MVKPEKVEAVAEIAELFRNSNAGVLTEYRGLSVGKMQELRRSMGKQVKYAVVKNTLASIAAKEAGIDAFSDELLSGPTAIAFVTGDPVDAAKGLRQFAKDNPALVIKAGYMEGKALSPEEINKLADLESREVLLAMLAGAMKASLNQAAYLFAAPLSKAVRTVDALRAKVEETGGSAAETPASSGSDDAGDAEAAAPADQGAAEVPAEA